MQRGKSKLLVAKVGRTKRAGRCLRQRTMAVPRAKRNKAKAPTTPLNSEKLQVHVRGLPTQGGPSSPGSELLPLTAVGDGKLLRDESGGRDLQSEPALAEKVKHLVQLAREQGFLTNSDVHE